MSRALGVAFSTQRPVSFLSLCFPLERISLAILHGTARFLGLLAPFVPDPRAAAVSGRGRLAVTKKSAGLDHFRDFRRHHGFPYRIAGAHFREHIRREDFQVRPVKRFDPDDETVIDQVLVKVPEIGRDLKILCGN